MKRIFSIAISIALLVTLTAGSFFYYAYISISEIIVKTEAQNALYRKDTQLEVIKLAKKGFNSRSSEVWYNNHLYDISSYRVVGDVVFVTVLHDDKEEVLVSVIKDYFAPTNDNVANARDHFSQKHYHSPNDVKCLCDGINIPLLPYSKTSMAFLFIESRTSCRSNIVDIPPPRI